MISNLWNKDLYLDRNIELLTNKTIIEYDLKSANTSLCKEYNLLSMDIILELEKLSKKKREYKVGKLMQKDKEFKDKLTKSFSLIRERFFDENNIEDKDILSIKKDAIFCLRKMDKTEFGYCNFLEKNNYSSYIYIDNLEIYYSKGLLKQTIDVKGINDDILKKHEGFMLDFFYKLFNYLETDTIENQLRFLNRFISNYKLLKLPVGYYREFNQYSRIVLSDSEETYDIESFIPYQHVHEHLNIDYNFFNILLPIVKILV